MYKNSNWLQVLFKNHQWINNKLKNYLFSISALSTPTNTTNFPIVIENNNNSNYRKIINMSSHNRFDGPPRKINRYNNTSTSFNQILYDEYRSPFLMSPPPPPPILVNCGELREHHHGRLIEIYGKVTRSRLGRFIEIKDKFGIIQLVAPNDNSNIAKQFLNIPLESHISVVGYVRKRPEKLKNISLPTGKVEIHVEDITRVQRPKYRLNDPNGNNKRNYSTMAHAGDTCDSKAITSSEYRKASTSDNLLQHFINREYTCGCLRMSDVNKSVSLVGWVDGKRTGKFIQLHDGYGQTQIIIDSDQLKKQMSDVTDIDIISVKGRVVARPNTHKTLGNITGEIEIYCDSFNIINPSEKYDGPIIVQQQHSTKEQSDIGNAASSQIDIDNIENDCNKLKSLPDTPNINMYTYRTHNCDELNESHIGQNVVLCGWLGYARLKKFFTLRDGYGHTQIIIPDELSNATNIENITFETILMVKGVVTARPPAMRNSEMATGAIEVVLQSLEILNEAKSNLPIEVRNFNRSRDSLRMEHRYIDLRFKDMQYNLRTRSNILMKIREYLIHHSGFIEVETPTLFRRTPGGAQEFIVPTRKPGHFYSLVQSPQQFKQMLMAGAIDRYFQIARCYRDEATRHDRQPEFTQLDIELSFTNRDNILELVEHIIKFCWPTDVKIPFDRLTYDEAMDKYGTDKPDLRFPLEMENITPFLKSNLNIGENNDDIVAYAIPLKDIYKNYNNSMKSILHTFVSNNNNNNNVKFIFSRIDKDINHWITSSDLSVFDTDNVLTMAKILDLQKKDTLLFAYGPKYNVQTLMGKIRLELMTTYEERKTIPKRSNKDYKFLWIIDFPMFTENEDAKLLDSTHHPFTAPHIDDLTLLSESTNEPEETHNSDNNNNYNNNLKRLLKVRSQAYDLVLNGQEIGGGSIRIHDSKLQKQILSNILKIDCTHLKHLLNALESGCPPHGGIALGIDRIISIICGTNSIKDVIAFPKTFDGKDLLSKAPCQISDDEMQLYNLSIINRDTDDNDNNSDDYDVNFEKQIFREVDIKTK